MSMVLALLAVLWIALPGAAQDRLDTVAAGVDRAITPATEAAAVERMAAFLGTPPDVLRAERAGARLGWGDLFLSPRVATRGGHPIAKVFAARRTGTAWGQIATEARVDADALEADVTALWPDAARTPPEGAAAPVPSPPASEARKGFGDRVRDFLRASPDQAPDDRPFDRTGDEIRDRMIRGGGRGR